uniref:Uncharacterized protein n=1 Tax=Salmonella sp. TaxID=599 RepID=A0A482ETA1_SALSP|nr:hypothetical protein NNIBIDOC_00083 [Salmonella sp.]
MNSRISPPAGGSQCSHSGMLPFWICSEVSATIDTCADTSATGINSVDPAFMLKMHLRHFSRSALILTVNSGICARFQRSTSRAW